MLGFGDALLAEAGLTHSGDPDTALVSQRLDSVKHVAIKAAEHTNLLTNFNFSVETPDTSQPKPDATPRTYAANYQVFYGWYADPSVGVTGLTYASGVINFTAGAIYQDVEKNGALVAVASVIASIAGANLVGTVSNVTLTDTGSAWRVSIAAGASDTLSAKLEAGTKITGHTALNSPLALSASSRYIVNEVLDSTAGYQLYNDGFKRQWGRVQTAAAALAFVSISPTLAFTTKIHRLSVTGGANGSNGESTTGGAITTPTSIVGWSASTTGTITFDWSADGF
ncbi:MAG: hypothetical protein KAR42_11110 [candidate division Zixibacteria bacterium]|nr:hypothetical protein [candidate division Zixibacteria bacterium]